MIDTREELINALTEASELEHGLMAQYLFAAFTLKGDETQDLSANQIQMITGWRTALFAVARQEMAHLAMVHNLLEIIGGGTRYDSANDSNQ